MRVIPRKSIRVSLDELKAAAKTLKQNQLLTGPEVNVFEKQFAGYIGTKYAIAVSSARIGIWTIFKALGFSEGEKVILSSYNFPVIPNIIKSMGLIPTFVDIDPYTYNIDVRKIEKEIDDKTRYMVITHMFGQPCDLEPIVKIAKKYNLRIIEDCAHACGSSYRGKKVGSFAEAGVFSFGIGKALVTFGGGMITTDDEALYKKIKNIILAFKSPGRLEILARITSGFIATILSRRFPFTLFVYPLDLVCNLLGSDPEDLIDAWELKMASKQNLLNHKLIFTNIQAAIGIEQLKKLDYLNALRTKNSEILTKNLNFLQDIKLTPLIKNINHIYLYYPLGLKDAGRFKKYLIKKGIDAKISEQKACSLLDQYSSADNKCILAESISGKVIVLPNSNLTEKDIGYIIYIVKEFFKKKQI